MIDNFSIFLFVNRFFKYIFDSKILNVSSIIIVEEESEEELEEYLSE